MFFGVILTRAHAEICGIFLPSATCVLPFSQMLACLCSVFLCVRAGRKTPLGHCNLTQERGGGGGGGGDSIP